MSREGMFSGKYLNSHEACRAAGITYRQLDYWTRHGYIVPYTEANGSGTRRRFDSMDVERLIEIREAFEHLQKVLKGKS